MKQLGILLFLQIFTTFTQGHQKELENDRDIQDTLIALSRRLPEECPVVLIHDEQMPIIGASQVMMKEMEDDERAFIVLDMTPTELGKIGKFYGINSTDPNLIFFSLLRYFYRKRRCYIFYVWLKDPRILYPETMTSLSRINEPGDQRHPGFRKLVRPFNKRLWHVLYSMKQDYVVLVVHHITKRYKTLINLRLWQQIPNIIALKRRDGLEGLIVNVFTVIPYFLHGQRKSQEIDVWLVQEKQFLKNNTLFFEKFNNFYNASISLGILWKEPFFIWGNTKDPWLDGVDWRLFMLCQEKLNFSFTVQNVLCTGRQKISNESDDDWTGMLGLLANGTIDVGVGGVSVTAQRLQYFDFCRTYYTDSYNFIAPLNLEVRTAMDSFLKPLQRDVWLTTFATIIIGIFTLKAVSKIEETFKGSQDSHFSSLSNNCGFVITIFCQKPYRHWPTSVALQAVYMGMIIMTFLLGMAFSSCLISVLLGFKPQPVADKVEDILKTKLPVFIKNYDGFLNDYMNGSNLPEVREIFQKAKLVDYYQSFPAMDEVVLGKGIYVDSKAKLLFSGRYRYSTGYNAIKYHVSSDSILEFDNLGWPVCNNWPFREKFDDVISRAVEGGLVLHWMERFSRGRFGNSTEAWRIPEGYFNLTSKMEGAPQVRVPVLLSNGKYTSLSMKHIMGVFIFYVIGIIVSTLSFLCECFAAIFKATFNFFKNMVKKKRKPQKQKKEKIECPNVLNKKLFKGQKKSQFPDIVWEDFHRTHLARNCSKNKNNAKVGTTHFLN